MVTTAAQKKDDAAAADDVASRYQKLDQREHALLRPGMYLGSVRPETVDAWVWEGGCLARREVRVTPGFVQAVQEVMSNAVDHSQRTRVTRIEVSFDPVTGRIRCSNDGESLSTDVHPLHGCRVPELVFGHMLASSNFRDDGKAVIGQNGLGAKIVNIFSKEFVVEIDDQKARRRYRQVWRDNMSALDPAEVTPAPKGRMPPKTAVEFLPDYARFGMQGGLDADGAAAVSKCVADAAAVTPKHTEVFLNGVRIDHKDFREYAVAHMVAIGAWTCSPGSSPGSSRDAPLAHERLDDNWEVAVACNPDGAGGGRSSAADSVRHVSFVNGLCTSRGGKHLEHVLNAVARRLHAKLSSGGGSGGSGSGGSGSGGGGGGGESGGGGGSGPTMRTCRAALWVFVSAQVPDPTFDSQTKSFLTTPPDAFKTRFECSDALLRAVISKTGVAEKIAAAVAAEGESKMKKSDGAHKTRIAGIPKLDDANWAGTKKSAECVLILTEGDSAKSTAIAGLSVVGRDRYGVFPLRGKLLNVRDATSAKIGDNEEIRCIKRILGLETGKDYSTASARAGLRYGSVLLLTDQDVDGFHIKALVFNLFDALWPSLARRPGFLRSLLTPIVKATVGSAGSAGSAGSVGSVGSVGSGKTREVSFYSMPEYEAWSRASTASGVRWTAKYYKGLGTSTSEDARRYFRDMKCVEYVVRDSPAEPLAGGADGRSGSAGSDSGRSGSAGSDGDGAPESDQSAPESDQVSPESDQVSPESDQVSPDGSYVSCGNPVRGDADALDVAFRKCRAEDRKRWLMAVDPKASLDPDAATVRMSDFVNRELCQFSWDDVNRSLPRVEDGFKTSQRKVLFGAFTRASGASDLRVAQLAGHVSTVAAYHHGEASLHQTIVGMAQSFVGCGHARFLTANGQFGTRIHGGKDSASPRYIHTRASAAARAMHPRADEPVLDRALDDDMQPVEPVVYAPVLPTVLLNGASGIGTGWSTSVPCLSPELVAGAYKERLAGGSKEAFVRAIADATPSYRGFVGAIVAKPVGQASAQAPEAGGGSLPAGRRWVSTGIVAKSGAKDAVVTELPVGVWTADFKEALEKALAASLAAPSAQALAAKASAAEAKASAAAAKKGSGRPKRGKAAEAAPVAAGAEAAPAAAEAAPVAAGAEAAPAESGRVSRAVEPSSANPLPGLRAYDAHYTDEAVHFTLRFDTAASRDSALERLDEFAPSLKLASDRGLSTTNMHLLDTSGRVRRYADCGEIADEHFGFRRAVYQRRIDHNKGVLGRRVDILRAKVGFVDDIVSGRLSVLETTLEAVRAHCRARGWPRSAAMQHAEPAGAGADSPDAEGGGDAGDYEYLLALPAGYFTAERRRKLEAEAEAQEAALEELCRETVESLWAKEIDEALAAIIRKP